MRKEMIALLRYWRASTRIYCSLAASLMILAGVSGCARPSVGPGLLERQEMSLQRLMKSEYCAREGKDPNLKCLHYVCTYNVSLSNHVPFLDPSVRRGHLDNSTSRVPASYCTVIGYPAREDGAATMCEIVVLKSGDTRTNVFILTWDSKDGIWRKAVENTEREGKNPSSQPGSRDADIAPTGATTPTLQSRSGL